MSKKMHRNALQANHSLHWYLIEEILGQGGFGITYLAYDQNLDQKVAIKEYLPIELAIREGDNSVYPVSQDHDERYSWGLDRFIKEARTLAQFKHPNIVRVLSVFEENNTAYMVMDYESGQCFQDVLTQPGMMDEAELIKILFPILGGLKQVHEAGFIHRDIKPANIFLRDDESPVLLDFGSARQALGEQTKSLTSIVSPGYAPYEQYYSKGDKQGPWTDIYGLGATMYRAITGRAPMDAIDRSEAILKTSRDIFVPAIETGAGKFSQRFLMAVDHAVQFDPDKRPQSIQEWMDEFGIPDEAPTVVAESREPFNARGDTTDFALPEVNRSEPPQAVPTVAPDSEPRPASVGVQPDTTTTQERSSALPLIWAVLLIVVAGVGFYLNQQGLIPGMAERPAPTAMQDSPPADQAVSEVAKPAAAPVIEQRLDQQEPAASPVEPSSAQEAIEDEVPERVRFLQLAQKALDDDRLTTPFNDSALFYYRSMLALNADDADALTGIVAIRTRLYEQALSAQKAGQYSAAKDKFLRAQALFPDDKELQNAYAALLVEIQQDELQRQIAPLLEKAQQAFAENSFVQPESASALAFYRQVLRLDAANKTAQQGIARIGAQLLRQARESIAADRFEQAQQLIRQSASLGLADVDIQPVQQALQDRRSSLLEQQQNEQKLTQLLRAAEEHMNALRLSSPKGRNALESLREALEIDPNNLQAHNGLRKIADEYIRLADRAINAQQLDRASGYVQKARSIMPDAESISLTEAALAAARKSARDKEREMEAALEAEKREAALEQQRLEQQRLQLAQQQAEQARADQREKERRESEAKRLQEQRLEQERKERERAALEASKKYMALKVTGIDNKEFSSVQLTKTGVLERTAKQLSAKGWEVITEQQAVDKPNALMLYIRFSKVLNTSVGYYSYAISVNILERSKLAVPGSVFSPEAIWNKGDSGIAQTHEMIKINGIIEGQVESFLSTQ